MKKLSLFLVMLFSVLGAFGQTKKDLQRLEEKIEELNIKLEILKATSQGDQSQEQEKFKVFGFFGTRFNSLSFATGNRNPLSLNLREGNSFNQSNLNLYFQFTPVENWKVLSEIRFLYNPGGQISYGETVVNELGLPVGLPVVYYDNSYFDPTTSFSYKWGGISLERAWADWTPKDYLSFRAGKFFTPFGIWNVDHGLPVLLSPKVPNLLRMIPNTQVGAMIYGKMYFAHSDLEYSLYVSNGEGFGLGREALAENQENNDDKSIGGRLSLKFQTNIFKELSIGTSGYYGKQTLDSAFVFFKDPEFVMGPNGPVFAGFDGTEVKVESEDNMTLIGFDGKINWNGLGLQGEYVLKMHDYTNFLQPNEKGAYNSRDEMGYYV